MKILEMLHSKKMITKSEHDESSYNPIEKIETKLSVREENIGFVCEECQKICQTRKQLTDHSRCHRKKKMLCSLCNKAYFALQAHMKICEEIKSNKEIRVKSEATRFLCDICNHESRSQMRLAIHLNSKHMPRPPKLHHCKFCDYQTKKLANVKRHEETCKEKYDNIIFI